jgi:hypothetical protein
MKWESKNIQLSSVPSFLSDLQLVKNSIVLAIFLEMYHLEDEECRAVLKEMLREVTNNLHV